MNKEHIKEIFIKPLIHSPLNIRPSCFPFNIFRLRITAYPLYDKGKQTSGGSGMANSKYEYVKKFEIEDEVMFPNIMVVRIDACNFQR